MKIVITITLMLIGMMGWGQNVLIYNNGSEQDLTCWQSALSSFGLVLHDTEHLENYDSVSINYFDGLLIITGPATYGGGISDLIVDDFLPNNKAILVSGQTGFTFLSYKIKYALGIHVLGFTHNWWLFGYQYSRYNNMSINGDGDYANSTIRTFDTINNSSAAFVSQSNGQAGDILAVEYGTYNYNAFSLGIKPYGYLYFTDDGCLDSSFIYALDEILDFLFNTTDIPEYLSEPHTVLEIEYYDVMGRKISKPTKGFYIECKTTDKGIISQKYFIQ